MRVSMFVMFGCLAAAILLTVILERSGTGRSDRTNAIAAWTAILCCYGVCVGLISALLAFFLQLSEWLTMAIAVPVACPVFWFLAKCLDS